MRHDCFRNAGFRDKDYTIIKFENGWLNKMLLVLFVVYSSNKCSLYECKRQEFCNEHLYLMNKRILFKKRKKERRKEEV